MQLYAYFLIKNEYFYRYRRVEQPYPYIYSEAFSGSKGIKKVGACAPTENIFYFL